MSRLWQYFLTFINYQVTAFWADTDSGHCICENPRSPPLQALLPSKSHHTLLEFLTTKTTAFHQPLSAAPPHNWRILQMPTLHQLRMGEKQSEAVSSSSGTPLQGGVKGRQPYQGLGQWRQHRPEQDKNFDTGGGWRRGARHSVSTVLTYAILNNQVSRNQQASKHLWQSSWNKKLCQQWAAQHGWTKPQCCHLQAHACGMGQDPKQRATKTF